MNSRTADVIMVIVYWALTLWWAIVVASTVTYLIWRPLYRAAPQPRRIMYAFLILAILFLLDSLYWSLANTARVGKMPDSANVSASLYSSILIATIKAIFLIAGIIFLFLVIMTYRQLEDRLETLYFTRYADRIVDAIGVLNPRGVVVYWNEGAERLYEQPRDRVLGRPIKNFLVPKRLHKHIDDVLLKIHKTNQAERFIAPRLKADQTEILVDITITPFTYASGEFGGYFGLMRPAAQPELEIPPKIEDVVPYEPPLSDKQDSDEIIQQIAFAVATQEKQVERRQKLAATIAIGLLIVTSILVVIALVADGEHKLVFGSGSLLTLLGEILPLRYLVKSRGEDFRARAIKKILNLPDMNRERLKMALEMLDTISHSLVGNSEDEGTNNKDKE